MNKCERDLINQIVSTMWSSFNGFSTRWALIQLHCNGLRLTSEVASVKVATMASSTSCWWWIEVCHRDQSLAWNFSSCTAWTSSLSLNNMGFSHMDMPIIYNMFLSRRNLCWYLDHQSFHRNMFEILESFSTVTYPWRCMSTNSWAYVSSHTTVAIGRPFTRHRCNSCPCSSAHSQLYFNGVLAHLTIGMCECVWLYSKQTILAQFSGKNHVQNLCTVVPVPPWNCAG